MQYTITSNSPEETMAFGQKLGAQLKGGEVIGLVGPLGSGKTHLIKGIAAGLGAKDSYRSVNSPTFVIVNEYEGKFQIYHVDAYRLNCSSEFEMLGFDDFCRPDSVVPPSITCAILGWSSKARAWRSDSKRAITCLESMPGLMTLSATWRLIGFFCSTL